MDQLWVSKFTYLDDTLHTDSTGKISAAQLQLNLRKRSPEIKNFKCDRNWDNLITCFIDRKDSIIDVVQFYF